MAKHRDCDIHYFTRISDDSDESEKKFLFQVHAVKSYESNEAGLSAKKLAFFEAMSHKGPLF